MPPGYAVPVGYPARPLVPTGPGGAPLADVGSRVAAFVLDGLVLAGPVLVLELLLVIPAFALLLPDLEDPNAGGGEVGLFFAVFLGITVVLIAVVVVMYYLYFVIYQLRKGQTVGKRVAKIRIVSAVDGSPMTKRQAVRRFVVGHLSGFLAPYFNYADGLWMLWDKPYRQCLHDKVAETVVVKVVTP